RLRLGRLALALWLLGLRLDGLFDHLPAPAGLAAPAVSGRRGRPVDAGRIGLVVGDDPGGEVCGVDGLADRAAVRDGLHHEGADLAVEVAVVGHWLGLLLGLPMTDNCLEPQRKPARSASAATWRR